MKEWVPVMSKLGWNHNWNMHNAHKLPKRVTEQQTNYNNWPEVKVQVQPLLYKILINAFEIKVEISVDNLNKDIQVHNIITESKHDSFGAIIEYLANP